MAAADLLIAEILITEQINLLADFLKFKCVVFLLLVEAHPKADSRHLVNESNHLTEKHELSWIPLADFQSAFDRLNIDFPETPSKFSVE